MFDRAVFGVVASCDSLDVVCQFIRGRPAEARLRREAAAYGMFLVAAEGAKSNTFFEEALAVLDRLAFAKAKLDSAAWHDLSVATLTASILLAAQQFVDEMTVACTEWPFTDEIASAVYGKARSEVDR